MGPKMAARSSSSPGEWQMPRASADVQQACRTSDDADSGMRQASCHETFTCNITVCSAVAAVCVSNPQPGHALMWRAGERRHSSLSQHSRAPHSSSHQPCPSPPHATTATPCPPHTLACLCREEGLEDQAPLLFSPTKLLPPHSPPPHTQRSWGGAGGRTLRCSTISWLNSAWKTLLLSRFCTLALHCTRQSKTEAC